MSFKHNNGRENHKLHYAPTVEIKDYNIIIDGRNFINQSIKNGLKTYDNVRNIPTGQGDDYTTGCLLDYPNFKNLL